MREAVWVQFRMPACGLLLDWRTMTLAGPTGPGTESPHREGLK